MGLEMRVRGRRLPALPVGAGTPGLTAGAVPVKPPRSDPACAPHERVVWTRPATGATPRHFSEGKPVADYKMTPRLQNVIHAASTMLADANQGTIGVEHVMMAILDDPRAIPTQVLAEFVEPARVQRALRTLVASDEYQAGNTLP